LLKKNEVKVTVIATGFPSGASSKGASLFTMNKEEKPEEKKEEAKSQGKIYNTITGGAKKKEDTKPEPASKDESKKEEPKAAKDIDDDDDWGAVPAFLRRSKLK
jgi:hypothetical protein